MVSCFQSKALVVTIQMLHLYHFQKMVLQNSSNSNSGRFPVIPAFEKKKTAKFFLYITQRFDKILLTLPIQFFITHENYD